MAQESTRAWFFRKFLSDAVVIGAITWVVLFTMELVKPGMVSFYLPLSKALFALLCLGLVALSLQPAQMNEASRKHHLAVLLALSLLSALVIYKTVDAQWWLTLLLILVTVGSIWASAILVSKS